MTLIDSVAYRGTTYLVERIENPEEQVLRVVYILRGPRGGSYNPDGSLDMSFGTGGKVTTVFGTIDDYALSVAVQGDGKIVATGLFSQSATQTAFALARYNPDGSLDTTFGTGGKVTTAFGTVHDEAVAVAVQGDGKIVAAGSTQSATQTSFALARYLNDACGTASTCASTTTTTATTTTAPTTTVTSSTTPGPLTTTTTTLPCTTARCMLGAALTNPACAGQTIPAGVTGRLATAENLIDQAATTPGKKGGKVRQKARNLLKQAGAKATHAAKGKKAKLSAACAMAVKDAAGRVATSL